MAVGAGTKGLQNGVLIAGTKVGGCDNSEDLEARSLSVTTLENIGVVAVAGLPHIAV